MINIGELKALKGQKVYCKTDTGEYIFAILSGVSPTRLVFTLRTNGSEHQVQIANVMKIALTGIELPNGRFWLE